MPELPEVEVSRRGLLPFLPGQRIIDAILRAPKLRHEIPSQLSSRLTGLRFNWSSSTVAPVTKPGVQ